MGLGSGISRAPVVRSPIVTPTLPRWGGGPPPPGPFATVPGPRSYPTRPGVDAFRATPDTYGPKFSGGRHGIDGPRDGRFDGRFDGPRRGRGSNHYGGVGYPGAVYIGASPYYYYSEETLPIVPADTARLAEPEGFLRLLISPRNASVFVDGAYEGTVDDFGGTGERTVRAGLHTVRVEADGFEPVEFDVRVPANDTITLRRDLDPRRAPPIVFVPSPSAPPAKPKTIYVIPRCYLGDSRPEQSQLPAGCSVADIRALN